MLNQYIRKLTTSVSVTQRPIDTVRRFDRYDFNPFTFLRYQRLRKNRKMRLKEKRCVVTGSKLISELLCRSKPPFIQHLYLDGGSEPEFERNRWEKEAKRQKIDVTLTLPVSTSREYNFLKMTGLSGHNDGVACELDAPLLYNARDAAKLVANTPNARILVLDGLQDPGNVGTLIRSAYLFQWDLICLGTGTADSSNDKVMRASGGTVWDAPMYSGTIDKLMNNVMKYSKYSVTYMVGDIEGSSESSTDESSHERDVVDVLKINLRENATVVLVLGNEGNGSTTPVPDSVIHSKKVTLKTRKSTVGSLGVASAGAILLHNLAS